jgi:hypothetical protein
VISNPGVPQAENGRRLLTSFDRLPGTDAQGAVDVGVLQDWATGVLQLAGESGLKEVAEMLVGQILANAPADADGTWPCQPVRELLEDLQSGLVERSLRDKLYNRGGLTTCSPDEGAGRNWR